MVESVERAILSTDLAEHFKVRGSYRTLLDSNTFNWSNNDHRSLIMSMIMTASDLSAIVKPFDIQRRTAEIVFAEFFEQGSLNPVSGVLIIGTLSTKH